MTLMEEHIDALIQEVRKAEIESKLPDGNFDFTKLATALLTKARQQASHGLAVRREEGCNLYYGDCNMEFIMWAMSMMTSAYVIDLLKGKVEVGHCQNNTHGPEGKRMCPKGSTFHKKMYDECVAMLKEVIELSTKTSPKVVVSPS